MIEACLDRHAAIPDQAMKASQIVQGFDPEGGVTELRAGEQDELMCLL